jgi:hypothetical protein
MQSRPEIPAVHCGRSGRILRINEQADVRDQAAFQPVHHRPISEVGTLVELPEG